MLDRGNPAHGFERCARGRFVIAAFDLDGEQTIDVESDTALSRAHRAPREERRGDQQEH